jgi:hypothetical protein
LLQHSFTRLFLCSCSYNAENVGTVSELILVLGTPGLLSWSGNYENNSYYYLRVLNWKNGKYWWDCCDVYYIYMQTDMTVANYEIELFRILCAVWNGKEQTLFVVYILRIIHYDKQINVRIDCMVVSMWKFFIIWYRY